MWGREGKKHVALKCDALLARAFAATKRLRPRRRVKSSGVGRLAFGVGTKEIPGFPSWLAAAMCVSTLAAGCYSVQPPPREPEYQVLAGPQRLEGGFGYLSYEHVAYADFFGEVKGLELGTGTSITLPIPPWLFVFGVLIVLSEGDIDLSGIEIDIEGDPADVWASGWVDAKRYVVSEFSMDVTVSPGRHRDLLEGGSLDYSALLLGVRLAGPRWRVPRYYVSGGYGWYAFDYSAPARADAHLGGPYLGLGLELFLAEHLSVALDYKMHFYFGEDLAGDLVDGGYRQVGVQLSLNW